MRRLGGLVLGLPVAIACRLLGAPDWCVFAGSALALIPLSVDGETNWLEGVQLLALYLIAAVSFFFLSGKP